MSLPTDSKSRKQIPITRGVLDYFPDAIAEVARVSFVGNEKHNPGQPMHWARDKSNDHADCIARHLLERGTVDPQDGLRHSAMLAWRALALLQLEMEAVAAAPPTFQGVPMPFVPVLEGQGGTGRAPTRGVANDDARQYLIDSPYLRPTVISGTTPPPPKSVMFSKVSDPADWSIPTPGPGIGTTPPSSKPAVYVAGPMRGYLYFNFPEFDRVRNLGLSYGFSVISPADLDRDFDGLDPIGNWEGAQKSVAEWTPEKVREVAMRDISAILSLRTEHGDAIVMLKDWEKSTGAVAEFFIARWLGLRVLDSNYASLASINWPMLLKSLEQWLEKNNPAVLTTEDTF